MSREKLYKQIKKIVEDEEKTERILKEIDKIRKEEMKERAERIKEGIREANMKGIVIGRPRKERPKNFEKVYEMYMNHEITSRAAGKKLKIAQSTFLVWCREYKERGKEEEREQIREISKKKKERRAIGRPKKERPKEFEKVYDKYMKHEITSREAGKRLKVAQSTFLLWCKEYKELKLNEKKEKQ